MDTPLPSIGDLAPTADDTLETLTAKLAKLHSEFKSAKEALEKKTLEAEKLYIVKAQLAELKSQSNMFRVHMLMANSSPLPDPLYLAQVKTRWESASTDDVCNWLLFFEEHSKLFATLLHEKSGKDALKDHVKKLADEKLRAAENYRNRPKVEAEERKIRAALAEEDKEKAKALRALMKAGMSEAAAREMLSTMLKLKGPTSASEQKEQGA